MLADVQGSLYLGKNWAMLSTEGDWSNEQEVGPGVEVAGACVCARMHACDWYGGCVCVCACL
jgi:hypothetical protein